MRISRLSKEISSSPTLLLNETAKKLKAQGKPVINLGVGEPANFSPLAAVERASARLETRMVKYTPSGGSPELKASIIKYTFEHYGRKPEENNILITNGAKQAIFNAFITILDHDDEVILMAPYWVSYPEIIKMASGKPVVVHPPRGKMTPRMDDVRGRVTQKTKAIILNNPNNPSGIVFHHEFIFELVKFCELNEIYLIMDDIYHQLIFGGTPWVPGYRITDRDIDSSYIVVINGVSKTYGMTGFRVGWAIASSKLIQVMTNIQSQTTSGVSIVTQDAALGALSGDQKVVSDLRETIRKNRDTTIQELQKIPDVGIVKPEGAFYCFPDFCSYNNDSMALSKFLLAIALVVVVPGIVFGMEGHLRISYSGNTDEIVEAIGRINNALRS